MKFSKDSQYFYSCDIFHKENKSSFFTFLSFIGLILVPNGEYLGYKMGDPEPFVNDSEYTTIVAHRTSAVSENDNNINNNTSFDNNTSIETSNSHPWGVFFTILGTVLLDFDADACQSPSRAYLLDVTLPGKISISSNK